MKTIERTKLQRHRRVRARVSGTPERPRLSVAMSLRHIRVQLIDDVNGRTLAAVTTVGTDIKGNMTERAAWIGQQIAAAGTKAKVKQVVFDRGSRQYFGRLAALADAARQNGLEF